MADVDRAAVFASNVEPVAQPNLSARSAEIRIPSPSGPQQLPDSTGAERRVRRTRPTRGARPLKQPVAIALAQQSQFDESVRVGPQLLSHIPTDIVRVHEIAQPHRNQTDRQPVGHVQKRHVLQMLETEIRVLGRQPLEMRLLHDRILLHGSVSQQYRSTVFNRQVCHVRSNLL